MTDYAERAKSHLVSQFSGSLKLRGMVDAYAGPLSDVSDVLASLKTERWIDTAIGVQLDGDGYIVGEERLGRSDDDYRDAIRYKIFANTTQATPTYLIRGLEYLTAPDNMQYMEMRPATALVFTDGFRVSVTTSKAMQDIAPAAISDIPVIVSYGYRPFRFAIYNESADFYVNDDLLEVDGGTLSVTARIRQDDDSSTFGGALPSTFIPETGTVLALDEGILLVYDPDTATLMGSDLLPGVYQ